MSGNYSYMQVKDASGACVAALETLNTVADCSTYSVGNVYAPSLEKAKALVALLFSKRLGYIEAPASKQLKDEKRRWCSKVLITVSPLQLADTYKYFAEVMDSIGERHTMTVKGWRGSEFLIIAWEVSKYHKDWESKLDFPEELRGRSVVEGERRDYTKINWPLKAIDW